MRLRRTTDDETARSALRAAAKLPPFHGLDLNLRYASGSWYYGIPLLSLLQPHSKAVAAAIAVQGASRSEVHGWGQSQQGWEVERAPQSAASSRGRK
jgi:hypothetical protein